MRQKNYLSSQKELLELFVYFAFRQIRMVEGKIIPAVLLPHKPNKTQPFCIKKL